MGEKIIGILGGMGPEATADLYLKIVRNTKASRDQEHIRTVIDSNPKIPDRTAAILATGENPVPVLVETAQNLQRAGAHFLVMPCNTAHYFYHQIQDSVSIPVLHMPNETVSYITSLQPAVSKVGLLGTTGTIKSGIYDQAFHHSSMELLVPDDNWQSKVMEAIFGAYGIKAGGKELPRRQVLEVVNHLIECGAEVIVAGCTELPLVLSQELLSVPLVDPTTVLAMAAVNFARNSD